ncbi:MAG: CheB methylesterase domain-containing protein, partial [Candidatus Rokubacteria bacterium]|nr:CheB methylesterase domain-containing protein [Candidatus Rokubacteria bacterium]
RRPRQAGPAASLPPRPIRGRGVQLVAVGASTGGPAAVGEILGELPATLRVPILVVQHIAKGFVSDLVQWWAGQTALGVKLARDGDHVQPATVHVAPDDWQLGVSPTRRIRLTRDAAPDGFRPSACHLFESVVAVYGASAMGVLLTGMGRDGAAGLKRLRDAGGVTVAQDQETSVVFGMPGEAIRLGAAEYVLSPGEIAALIKSAAIQP